MDSPKGDGDRQQNDHKKAKGKLKLKTSNKEYGGSLGLPENIVQREYETTGQFLRRIDRLVAKAKVEANLDSRFDTKLGKVTKDEQQRFDHKPKQVKKKKPKRRRANNDLDDTTSYKPRKNFRKRKGRR